MTAERSVPAASSLLPVFPCCLAACRRGQLQAEGACVYGRGCPGGVTRRALAGFFQRMRGIFPAVRFPTEGGFFRLDGVRRR